MRQGNFAGQQWVIFSNVSRWTDGAMLQFDTQSRPELFMIKLHPPDAQFFSDCFRLIQGKCGFAHDTKMITGNTGERDGVFTSLKHSFFPIADYIGLAPKLRGKIACSVFP